MPKPIILLIEDDPDDEYLTRRAAAGVLAPYEIVVLRDGAAAVSYLLAAAPERAPVLVLLDINLPKLNGFEVLERLSERRRDGLKGTRWVVVSTSAEPKDVAAAERLGVSKYLQKPSSAADSASFARELASVLA